MDHELRNLARAAEVLGRAEEAEHAKSELAKLRSSDPRHTTLDNRLAAVLKGEKTPHDDVERLQLAWYAQSKSLNAGSARLYTETFANDPKLADDRQGPSHRYNAACPALLAAFGQGKDAPPYDDAARVKLRTQAREWLQAELSAWAKVIETGPAEMKARVASTLQHWKDDTDLVGIRDEKELVKLPGEERSALKSLWIDVDHLLTRAVGSK